MVAGSNPAGIASRSNPVCDGTGVGLAVVEGMRYQSIQMLRAIAALMVVVVHTNVAFSPEDRAKLWWWPGFSDHGYVGVSLFFVISGFIIANWMDRADISLSTYAWRRFWRIVPLYWIVMAAGLYWHRTYSWYQYNLDTLGMSGMIKSALILPMQEHPFWAPGWSLEHEVIFYVIAALIAPFFGLRVLAAVMVGLGATGLLIQPEWDYHLLSEYQILFGAGIVAYLLRDRPWRIALPIAVIGLAGGIGFYYGLPLPREAATPLLGIGTAGLIIALLDVERLGWRVPWPVVLLGNATFSLYLWHWALIPYIARWAYEYGGEPEFWRWVMVLASIGIALASYLLVEKPCEFISHLWRRRPTERRPATEAVTRESAG